MSPVSGRTARPFESDESDATGMSRRLLTYSDMITLLLVLFIVLYSLSSLNERKYAEFLKGVDRSFHGNVVPTKQGVVPGAGSAKSYPTTKTKPFASVATIKAALEQALAKAGLLPDVTITVNAQGLVEGFIAGNLFYLKDIARLSALGNEIVDVTATVIRRYANPVTVDGFADSEPITGGPYINNWQLSAERAVYVVTRLNDTDHVDPTQLSLVGFGQYHPVVPNNSTTHEAENRRVNIDIAGTPLP